MKVEEKRGFLPHIVLIDDNEDQLSTLGLLLGNRFKEELEVVISSDGDAIDIMHELEGPAVVFVDMNLGRGKLGIDLIREMSGHSRFPAIFYIMSGDDSEESRLKALENELVHGYIVKGIAGDEEMFVAEIKATLRSFLLLVENSRDPLTNLHTRSEFKKIWWREVERKQRGETRRDRGILIFVDADRLKYINDTYGHEYGDKALKAIANVSQESVFREGGLVCRHGGDEFLILLVGSSVRKAKELEKRLRMQFDNLTIEVPDGKKVDVTVSVGVVTFRLSDLVEDFENKSSELIDTADKAMYEDKKRKKEHRKE